MLDKKNKSNSANIGALLLSRGTGLGMIVILCLLGLRAPLFFEMTNIMTVLKQGSVLTMIALGLTAVLIGGGFDMGAGALVQLTCNLAAGLLIAGTSVAAAITSGIAVGFLVGLINAFLVIIVKIPTFVATLGTMFVMQGVTSWYNDGKALTIKAIPGFSVLGQRQDRHHTGNFPDRHCRVRCAALFLQARRAHRMYQNRRESEHGHH